MRRICSVDVVRQAEARAGVAEPVLMARASAALAAVCIDLLKGRGLRVPGARVVALIGSGNNGGDALWALSILARRGAGATAIGDPGRMHPAGFEAARSAGATVLAWDDPRSAALLGSADLALDGILGIGGAGGLRGPAAGAAVALRDARVPVVAVDVPSGVDSDTAEASGVTVRADVTVCFGVLKPALVLAPGRSFAGAVTVADIGLHDDDLEPAAWALSLSDLAGELPPAQAHKYTRGVVGVTAGSPDYPGAALLAVRGARGSGAGMVAFTSGWPGPTTRGPDGRAAGGIDPVSAMVVSDTPDVVPSAERVVDARCVGPGLGTASAAMDLVLREMSDPAPMVLDASALAVLGRQDGRRALADRADAGWVTVLTPHAGEFARLGFDPAGGRLVAAGRAARESGAIIVFKGPGTVIAGPDSTFVDLFGDSTLATAGTGDVLAGLMAGMLAERARAHDLDATRATLVAARAVGLHGLAGRLAAGEGHPVTATDVVSHLRAAHAAAAAERT